MFKSWTQQPKICEPGNLLPQQDHFKAQLAFPETCFLVSPGRVGLLYLSLHQPVSNLASTNLGFETAGRSQDGLNELASSYPTCILYSIRIYIYKFNRENWITPVSLLFDFLDVEERRTTSICASQLPHLEDTWLRAPDHQQGTLDVSGCMNNCAPGEKDAVRVRSSEWPWNCRRVSSELLLASTISTCTAHQQCVFVPLVLLWRVHSIFIKRWFCFVWHVFWVLRCFDVHVVHHIAPANPYCFHLLVHINPIGLHLWLAMCCWESTGRWRREWSDAWFDLELQWTNGYLISSHHVSIMLCPQSFLQFCTKMKDQPINPSVSCH